MPAGVNKRLGMAVNLNRCVGCSACAIACKSENNVPPGRLRRWIHEKTAGRFPDLKMQIWSESCMHCEDAPCVHSCPTGASHVDAATGTVQVHPELCTGCKACMASCPYDARYVHPDGYIDKCTLCVHKLEHGEEAACQSICPTSAIAVGDLDDPTSEISRWLRDRNALVRKPEAGTKPKFFLVE
ncbi:MAG: 4Fe-4S dicluster domain-containing protein [Planctomycetota bacterium]|nr:MAG: 4Fe-4S dicluster domain-containing protein [Planctomycetota bacterium]